MGERLLIDYLPNVLQEVREFKALTLSEQPEVKSLFDGIGLALSNEFVITSTEYGIKRWEKLLNIIPNPFTENLEFRRARILLRLQIYLPFTEKWLRQKLEELFGADNVTFTVSYNEYKINTTLSVSDMNLLNEVKLLFKKIIPANMSWAFQIIAVLLESILYVGLHINTTKVKKHFFSLIPEYYPLQTISYAALHVDTRVFKNHHFDLTAEYYPLQAISYAGVTEYITESIKFEV